MALRLTLTERLYSLGPGYSISYNPHPDPSRGSGASVKHSESIRLSYENAKVRPHLQVSVDGKELFLKGNWDR